MNFSVTKEQDISVYGINKWLNVSDDCDVDRTSSRVRVLYQVDIEAREWGIKSVSISINRVEACIEWSVSKEEMSDTDKEALLAAGGWSVLKEEMSDTDKEALLAAGGNEFGSDISGEIEIVVDTDGWKCINEMQLSEGGLSVGDIEIDFKSKTITVQ